MEIEADVVVVGGGPAGAATALELARRGRSVVVCEKAAFPRDKSCGDGLTPRAVQALLDLGLSGEVARWPRIVGVRAHGRGRSREFRFPTGERWPSYGVVVPRRELDAIVLGRAQAAGASVMHGAEVTGVRREPDGTVSGVTAEHGGEHVEIAARWVVCADGTGGKAARALGTVARPGALRALAVRQYFPAAGPAAGAAAGSAGGWFDVFLDVRSGGRIVPGYGWVFPVGDGTVNAGIGFNSTAKRWRGASLHQLMAAFEDHLTPEWGITAATATCPPRAGRLALGGGVGPLQGPGFVVVGDAAGWINPATGEGIAYAYETGRLAGTHIQAALSAGRSGQPAGVPSGLPGYEADLRKGYDAYFRLGRLVARGLGNPTGAAAMVAGCMAAQVSFDFVLTVLTHLDGPGRSPTQVGFRALERLARVGS